MSTTVEGISVEDSWYHAVRGGTIWSPSGPTDSAATMSTGAPQWALTRSPCLCLKHAEAAAGSPAYLPISIAAARVKPWLGDG